MTDRPRVSSDHRDELTERRQYDVIRPGTKPCDCAPKPGEVYPERPGMVIVWHDCGHAWAAARSIGSHGIIWRRVTEHDLDESQRSPE